MDETRREQIQKIIQHFGGKIPAAKVLTDYCQRMKISPAVVPSDLIDYTVQVTHDDKMSAAYPEILAEVGKMVYVPEYAGAEYRKKLQETNENIVIEIVKILEKHGLRYHLVEPSLNEMGHFVGGALMQAGKRASNKAIQVMSHLTCKQFGLKDITEFDLSMAEKYTREVFTEAEKKNKEKTTPAGDTL